MESFESALSKGIKIMPPGENHKPYQFELTTDSGSTFNSTAFKGKIVIVYEWATWCLSCPAVKEELKKLMVGREKDFVFVAVNHDQLNTAAHIQEKLKDFPPGTVHISLSRLEKITSGLIEKSWSIARTGTTLYGIPTVTIIDREGKLIDFLHGPSPQTLQSEINQVYEDGKNAGK